MRVERVAERAPLERALLPQLPARFFVNLPVGYQNVFADTHEIAPQGEYVKMQLEDASALGEFEIPGIERLGPARAVCARLPRELSARVPLVGLNVATANAAALRCYEALGFRAVLRYEEGVLTRRDDSPGGLGR